MAEDPAPPPSQRPDTTPKPVPISEQILDSCRHAMKGGVLNPEDIEKILGFVEGHPAYMTADDYPGRPETSTDAQAVETTAETPATEETTDTEDTSGLFHRKKRK